MPDRRPVLLATTVRAEGGVLRHVIDLADGLAGRGIDVTVAAPRDATRVRAAVARAHVRFRSLGSPVPAGAVYHLHLADTYDRLALPLLSRARIFGARTVVTEHLPRSHASDASLTPDPRTWGAASAKTLLKRLQFRMCDAVIAVSASSRDFVQSRYGIEPGRISVVENGIAPSRASGRRSAAERSGVLSIGSLIHQKGHADLIHAAGSSLTPWPVTIAGDGWSRDELELLAASLAPGRITFTGWVRDVSPLLASAAVMCLPSRWESFPYAVIEAQAAGLPVVGTDVDGIRDQIEHDRTGLLVRPGDSWGLARAIDRLMADPALRDRLAAHGAVAAGHWTSGRMLDGIERVYAEAAGAARASIRV